MRVLLIGSGGREHALAWALSGSPLLSKLFVAPGNGGIGEIAHSVSLDISDHSAVIEFCRHEMIELVVVGPEAPLVAGLSDDLNRAGFRVFGPRKGAARLEGSKRFTKMLCTEHNIPTAKWAAFSTRQDALAYLQDHELPVVIKADGLAAGKGVIIAQSPNEAKEAVDALLGGEFGAAGAEIVIEEFLQGEEASFFALCDGTNILPLATAQDYKRAGEGDTGPNTGGMGAYSPVPVMNRKQIRATLGQIIEPTIQALANDGMPFTGVLYAGLMITETGPKLIEYNVRFGDPECQVLMVRLKEDLLTLINAAVDGVLNHARVAWHDDPAVCVVMAAAGYPGAYEKGSEIKGLDAAAANDHVEIFHAGTLRDDGRILANGGRVLNVVGRGKSLAEARANAYEAVEMIDWPQGQYRGDIAQGAIDT